MSMREQGSGLPDSSVGGSGQGTTMDLAERLAGHATLGAAPRQELEWLAAHGSLQEFAEGDVLSHKGVQIEGLFIVLSGRVAIFVDRGAGTHKVMEWRAGDVTGVLPYSRLLDPPGDSLALEPSSVLVVHRDLFPAMIRECQTVTSILVHKMLDRARFFTSSDLHDEKMASLGKLSAGLAHELNNPAGAIERSASLLEERLEDAERATRALGASRLSDRQLGALDAVRASCLATSRLGVLSPIEQAEREDAITDWLAGHGLDARIAGPLAETAVTLDALDRIAAEVTGPPLEAVLRWAAAGCSVRGLASEIQEAATRISGLVTAIKGFTHMDQGTEAEPVDLALNLQNTVAVLRSKARAKSVAVAIRLDPDLPRVRGFVGELNQIWANLIDNALDAAPPSGRVEVTAARQHQFVVVRVIDDGPGIPAEIRERIFDPFFTTKPVGQGTGLGLDIVRRLVVHNDAQIEVESRPGRTVFSVSLPLDDREAAGGKA
ncbi:MAG: phoR 5 [Acidobacteria bacterium]|nr:phoR 5 [Acidobacteriota bacterium]